MNYWWVNLGETYKYEVKGFMWSPQLGARGPVPAYENMKRIRPGDVIFAFADTYIKAMGIAVSPAQASPKTDFGQNKVIGSHFENCSSTIQTRLPLALHESTESHKAFCPKTDLTRGFKYTNPLLY